MKGYISIKTQPKLNTVTRSIGLGVWSIGLGVWSSKRQLFQLRERRASCRIISPALSPVDELLVGRALSIVPFGRRCRVTDRRKARTTTRVRGHFDQRTEANGVLRAAGECSSAFLRRLPTAVWPSSLTDRRGHVREAPTARRSNCPAGFWKRRWILYPKISLTKWHSLPAWVRLKALSELLIVTWES